MEFTMPVKLDNYLNQLPERERQAIEVRAATLIEEEATLRELRAARERSQEQIAERLGIKQSAVSKLERRTDMYVSTLRDLIRAMGGELDIVARFPNHRPVRITQFRSIKGELLSQS
jgi:DNA-directed RNA polymerase sigma subunit (sigma70/sigma32)